MVYAEDYGEEAYVEVNQGIEAVSEDEQQNAVVTDETSQTATDGEGVESDTDLAKARESETGEAASWKDKLKEGSYLNYFGHVQTYGDLTYVSDGEDFGTTGESKRLAGQRMEKWQVPRALLNAWRLFRSGWFQRGVRLRDPRKMPISIDKTEVYLMFWEFRQLP